MNGHGPFMTPRMTRRAGRPSRGEGSGPQMARWPRMPPGGRGAPTGAETTFAQQAPRFRKARPLPQMEYIYAGDDSGLQKDARLAKVAAANSAGGQGGTLADPSQVS